VSAGSEKIIDIIRDYAEPLLAEMELELVEIQFRREGHGWVLRLFIDSENGVTIDDCAAVSREISAYLDVEDLIEHAYHLEVSSPGLERPLKKKDDFVRFAGRNVKIKLHEPLDGQKVFTGILQGMEEGSVVLLVDDVPLRLRMDHIARARLAL
jgi:ribosome maturation factor RimP